MNDTNKQYSVYTVESVEPLDEKNYYRFRWTTPEGKTNELIITARNYEFACAKARDYVANLNTRLMKNLKALIMWLMPF